MSSKTKQHGCNPRAGIRCSVVHSPDRTSAISAAAFRRRTQTVKGFERKEFSHAAVAAHSSRRTFRCDRTQHVPEPAPGQEEVLIFMEAAPMDPSDLLFVRCMVRLR